MKKPMLVCALIASLFASTDASAALNAYLRLTGAKQGAINGSVTQKGRENKIMVIAVDHQVSNPVGGKKTHGVFTITKELDKSSPHLYQALTTGEPMTSFELQFWTPQISGAGGVGAEVQHYTVKLTNARITDIKFRMANNKNPELMRYAEYEEVSFTYDKIEWSWLRDSPFTAADGR